jgi:branched-chain amino acid transport system ATP-binding protein
VALLEVTGLTRRFGGLVAVNDVSLTVETGEIHGLIGPNGAGKTTLFNVISGSLPASGGRVMFDGADVTGLPIHRLASRGMVRTFQHSQLFLNFSVYRNVLAGMHIHASSGFWAGLIDSRATRQRNAALAERAHELVRFVGLGGLEDAIAGSLPHGHKRLLQVAIGLGPEPKLLLMDEPVAGMNHADVDRMMQLVRTLPTARGTTVVLVEHNMKAVMNTCDRISVLQFGRKIAAGLPGEVAADQAVIDAYLGVFDDDVA